MYSHNSMQFAPSATSGVKQIITACSVVFVLQNLFPGLNQYLLLFFYQSPWFFFWQPLSYMFAHQGLMHILFNMFALWMFGSTFERAFGKQEFLKLYFACGLGTGLIWTLIPNALPMLGASGAVYGLLVAFAYFWPRALVLLFGILPVRAKTLVLGLIGLGLFLSARPSPYDNIAHIAHLIGSAIAFVYLQLKYQRYQFLNFNLRIPIRKMRGLLQRFRKK